MATYDLTASELSGLLLTENISPAITQSIINYLDTNGGFTGPGGTTNVQEGGPLSPSTQVLLVDTPTATVATDANLLSIVDIADASLTVTGSKNVLVATGDGNDRLDLSGTSGRDVVLAGSGNDTIFGGTGADTITVGDGNDIIHGSSRRSQPDHGR